MALPALDNYPTDELVAAAWIATIPGFSQAMVATQLPADADRQGNPAPWVATGFVTVAVVGGTPNADLPQQAPVMQVDCYATVPGSNKPPWYKANRLAAAIVRAARNRTSVPRALTISSGPVTYGVVSVQSAYVTTSPRRIYDDVGDYARYQLDAALTWIVPGEHIT